MHNKTKEYPQSVRLVFLLVGTGLYWVWAISGLFSTLVWYSQEGGSWFYVVGSNALTLAALFLLSRRLSPYIERMPFVVGSGIITCAGIVLATLALNLTDYVALLIPGALLTGIGSAPLILLWREASEQLASKAIQKLFISVAIVLATLFYLLFISLPFPVALVVCSLAPIAAAFLFRASYTPRHTPRHSVEPAPETTPPSMPGIPVFLLLCCFAFAMTQGVFKSPFLRTETTISWTLAVSCAVLVMIAVLIGDFYLAKRMPASPVARAYMPTMTVLLTALPFFVTSEPLLMSSLVFAGHWLFTVYLYSELDASFVAGLSGTQVLALGLCAIDFGYFAGMALGYSAKGLLDPLLLGSLLGIVGIVALLARLRFSKEQERFDAPKRTTDEAVFEAFNHSVREDMLEGIRLQCTYVAKSYRLSDREQEVLFSLVCGKSAKTMSSELFISYNTVKTHISHIYQKMDVHGREELISLITQEGEPCPQEAG